ncbi:putative quinol monooxygenase [Kitasatospora sp. NPDC058965]|uniref:putative quinol monooxygenase n=1 Tax=Kitasatospora sp. NPDC058965 TaxID=3346682 RepID=UPI0036951E98
MRVRNALLPLAVAAALAAGATTAGAADDGKGKTQPSRDESVITFLYITEWENIPANTRDHFIAAAQNDGYESLKNDPSVESFHVVPDPDHADRLTIAEVFTNQKAYQAHQQGPYEQALLATAQKDGVSAPTTVIANYNIPATKDGEHFSNSVGDNGTVFTAVATFTNVQPQYRDEFIKIAQADGVDSFATEPGTLSFAFAPDPTDPTRFVFMETFTDRDAFYYHKNNFPAQRYLDVVAKSHIIGPDFTITNSNVGFDHPGGWSVPNAKR